MYYQSTAPLILMIIICLTVPQFVFDCAGIHPHSMYKMMSSLLNILSVWFYLSLNSSSNPTDKTGVTQTEHNFRRSHPKSHSSTGSGR